MNGIEGFILTGGKSSRMGTDKARLRLGAETFAEKIAAALGSMTERVRPVGGFGPGEVGPAVPDVYREWGALGGLHAALAACQSEWAAVVACDLPFVTGELFARLAALRADFEAVVPIQSDGRAQPLCALYRKEPCLGQVEELIRAGERRPRALLERVRTRRVEFRELADLTDSALFFININTPADYSRAREAAGQE